MKDKATLTKELILKTANELFSTIGYDKTPISFILEKAGISKGGFYHHFKSKEEIIDTIAKLQVDHIVKIIVKISEEKGPTAIEKFNKLIEQVQLYRIQNRDQFYKLFQAFLRNDNLILKDKIDRYTLEMVKPSYIKIVLQGIEEGVFHTSSPELAVETIIKIVPELRLKMALLYLEKEKNDHFEADIGKVADFLEELVVKILAAEKGLLNISALFKSYFSNM